MYPRSGLILDSSTPRANQATKATRTKRAQARVIGVPSSVVKNTGELAGTKLAIAVGELDTDQAPKRTAIRIKIATSRFMMFEPPIQLSRYEI